MGAISDALKQASGVVSQGVNSATNAAGLTSGAGASGSMPQMDMSQQILSAGGMDPSQVALSGPGIPQGALSQVGPSSSVPGLSLNDLLGGNNTPGNQQLAMLTNPGVNNPYAPEYAQSSPQEAAASIGAPSGPNWQPTHKEGTLAKVGDFFFHNMFRDRTVAANERDALEASMDPSGRVDPQAAAQKLYSIPGANPLHVADLLQTQGQTQFYNDYGKMRNDESQKSALGVVAGAFGAQSAIGMAMAAGKDPGPIYTQMRPLLDKTLDKAGIPEDLRQQILPEKFDPDTAQTVASMGVSTADQARIALEQTRTEQQKEYQGQEINLRTVGLKLQQAELGVRTAEAASSITKNNSDFLSNKQSFYTKVLGPAAKIPWLYGNFMSGKFGGGSSNVPKPGVAYVSPDKTAAAEMTAQGQWKIYDITKGTAHAKLVGTLGGGVAASNNNGDFEIQ